MLLHGTSLVHGSRESQFTPSTLIKPLTSSHKKEDNSWAFKRKTLSGMLCNLFNVMTTKRTHAHTHTMLYEGNSTEAKWGYSQGAGKKKSWLHWDLGITSGYIIYTASTDGWWRGVILAVFMTNHFKATCPFIEKFSTENSYADIIIWMKSVSYNEVTLSWHQRSVSIDRFCFISIFDQLPSISVAC